MIEALHARVGNRRVARMIVSSQDAAAGAVLHRSADNQETHAGRRASARRAVRDVEAELDGVTSVAEDVVRETPGQDVPREVPARRPPPPRATPDGSMGSPQRRTPIQPGSRKDRAHRRAWVRERLGAIAGGTGEHAERATRALGQLDEVEERLAEARGQLTDLAEPHVRSSYGNAPAKGKPAGGGGTAAKSADKAAAGAGETAATQLEKAGPEIAGDVGTKGEKLYRRLAARIGLELLEGLVPDPLDAIGLMVDFAGSYAEARKAIRGAGLRDGFAVGFAAYLVVPRWGWAKSFAHTAASRDVATQVVGAVGVAENAFNEGLVRGFVYGEKHTPKQSDTVRQKAFWALQRLGRTPGRDDGDDLYTFGRDDVYEFAAVLRPTAVSALAEADRRRKKRQESEELRKQMERWKRVPTGADKW